MIHLTERQQKVLNAIVLLASKQGVPPSIREIQVAAGERSTSTIHRYLDLFQEQRLLTRGIGGKKPAAKTDGKRMPNRCIKLNWEILSEMGLRPPNSFPILGHIVAGEPIQVDPKELANVEGWVSSGLEVAGEPKEYFALKVKGNSMIDAGVLDGDLIILHSTDQAERGKMVAAWIEGDDEITLKYFFHEGDTVRLQPANPDYKPILRPAEKVHVQGKVIEVIRRMEL